MYTQYIHMHKHMHLLTHSYMNCSIKQECIAAAPCATQTVSQLPGTIIKAEKSLKLFTTYRELLPDYLIHM